METSCYIKRTLLPEIMSAGDLQFTWILQLKMSLKNKMVVNQLMPRIKKGGEVCNF